ncbi:hypothetical protein FACS189434_07530 [Bacteroidia bacterium]|nr:hypothetical protein FACS189434_07530 [Bacteroidia bacterium]
MKTLKMILLIGTLFCISGTMAQTYYYDTSKTFSQNGYTYHCNTQSWGYVTLFNANNIYTDAKYVYKNGSTITNPDILDGTILLIAADDWTKQKCMSIVDNAFSAAEKTRVKGKEFDVSMTIDTNTGKVIEVDFRFYKNGPFATIPVTTYRIIEQNLKNQVWFTLTSTGKQLKFVQRGWMHEVE